VPGKHPGLTVDANGYRLTVAPAATWGADSPEIFLFGGSAMWGFTARDAFTIPSRVAVHLAREGLGDVAVRSRSQSSYNFTQNVASLNLELRNGARPAVVVFMDGVNEVGPVVIGEPSARLRPAGDEFGFRPLFFLQPTLAMTKKPQSPWETQLLSGAPGGLDARMSEGTRGCMPLLEERLVGASDFYPLHEIFDGVGDDVFIDHFGQVREDANDVIAAAVVARVTPALRALVR
jgi:hypothetical protein